MTGLTKTREEIISKAEELAIEYEAKYKCCGQCTFLAVINALRWGGWELIPRDMEERFFSGICLLTAGAGMTGDGTCGAVDSSVILIGLALGITRETQDDAALHKGSTIIRETILDRYYQEYGSIMCRDVLRKFFGRNWDFSDEAETSDFLQTTQGCTIIQTAVWTTEILLDELDKGRIQLPAGN